ncbi:MAG: class I SAM-dependent methyltransferase [bacterium]
MFTTSTFVTSFAGYKERNGGQNCCQTLWDVDVANTRDVRRSARAKEMKILKNTYDTYADEYVNLLDEDREKKFSLYHSFIVPTFLYIVGEVRGLHILDAGCGEGSISRILSEKGGIIVGIDIAPRLIDYARNRDVSHKTKYMVYDLSTPLPEYENRFDLVVSNLVLDDVPDYIGFISTISVLLKLGGRAVFSLNNPYSAVIRGKVNNYFNSETSILYNGLSSRGVKVYYFHRTLETYMREFHNNGFRLETLSDVRPTDEMINELDPERYGRFYHFPFFMMMAFRKT